MTSKGLGYLCKILPDYRNHYETNIDGNTSIIWIYKLKNTKNEAINELLYQRKINKEKAEKKLNEEIIILNFEHEILERVEVKKENK